MKIETERLLITELNMDMAKDLHKNLLDEDNRRFVPDEVFHSIKEASDTTACLMEQYLTLSGHLSMLLL